MQQRSLAIEPKYLAAHYGHDESFLVNCGYQKLLLLAHKGNNCTGSHSVLIHMLCDQEGIALPKTRDVPISGIMWSQGGHFISGQMAKAFSSA